MFPKVYDKNMKPLAILENAEVGYAKIYNGLWEATVVLPADDDKNQYCTALNYIEIFDGDERVDLFRVVPTKTARNSDGSFITYELEHVLATLLDDVLFKYHERVALDTTTVFNYILDKQTTKNWVLGVCDFTHYFSYKWENDNLLGAFFSVPKPFIDDWQVTWDTTAYPWTINIIKPSTTIQTYVRYGKNLESIERVSDPTNLVNRLYCLGYGEGVNQLGIDGVNGGTPYVEDTNSINKYGLISRVWVDRRYENADTLLNAGKAMLNELKEPYHSYTFNAADLYKITKHTADKFEVGAFCRAIDEDLNIDITTKVVRVEKPNVYGAPGDVNIEIANKSKNVAGTIAELADRQRIHETYAQGATNLDSHDFVDNCDPTNPAKIKFYLPTETVRINKLTLTYQTEAFRAYSKAIKGGGSTTATTTSGGGSLLTSGAGGGTTVTSTAGGGVLTTTGAGGGTTKTSTLAGGEIVTSAAGGSTTVTSAAEDWQAGTSGHNHGITDGTKLDVYNSTGYVTFVESGQHKHSISIPDHSHSVTTSDHSHDVTLSDHSHSITLSSHSHDVTLSDHSHSVDVPSHTHDLTLTDHTHAIDYGIYNGPSPLSVDIKVDGNATTITATSGQDIDLVPFLSKDTSGKITRGWHEVVITPDNLGRVVANIVTQLFVQSRGGGDY